MFIFYTSFTPSIPFYFRPFALVAYPPFPQHQISTVLCPHTTTPHNPHHCILLLRNFHIITLSRPHTLTILYPVNQLRTSILSLCAARIRYTFKHCVEEFIHNLVYHAATDNLYLKGINYFTFIPQIKECQLVFTCNLF